MTHVKCNVTNNKIALACGVDAKLNKVAHDELTTVVVVKSGSLKALGVVADTIA